MHAVIRLWPPSGSSFRRPDSVFTNSVSARIIGAGALFIVLLRAFVAPAQEPFRQIEAGTNLRDVAVNGPSGVLFFSAYARGEVWKTSAATGELIAKAKSGNGPANLALSLDKRFIACVNKLSTDAAVFEADTMVAAGTFACGAGASDVTALGDSAFAVVNSFADTVTIIDVLAGKTALIEDVGQVPNGAAYSAPLLGVTTRLPGALILLDISNGFSSIQRKRVVLPATPVAIVAESDACFLVATETGLVRVDGRSGNVLSQSDVVAQDLATCGERILALRGDTLVEFDAALRTVTSTPLAVPATRVDCSGGLIALVAPLQEVWLLNSPPSGIPKVEPVREEITPLEPLAPAPESPAAPEPPTEAPVTPPAVSEPVTPVPAQPSQQPPAETPDSRAPAVVEAQPIRESKAHEQAPVPVTPPAREIPPQARETIQKPEPENVQEAREAQAVPPVSQEGCPCAAEPVKKTDGAEEAEQPAKNPYALRPYTFEAFRTGAPEFTREAPEEAPMSGGWPGSLGGAFARGWDFASLKGAFEQQNWNQPLEFRGVKADRFKGASGKDGKPQRLTFQGNVSWDWAESSFRAQTLEADRESREIVIEQGHIQQKLSSLDADRLYYRYPSESDEDIIPLIDAQGLTEQERARRLYTLGYGEADNIELIEPFRELRAKHAEYDFAKKTGSATDVRGRLDVLYFGIDELEMTGPGRAYARDAWVTTCPGDPPVFRLRLKEMEILEDNVVVGRKGRLQIGKFMTPLYWPKWTFRPGMDKLIDIDFDSGRAAELGYYLNYGQRFALSKDAELGFRFFPTEEEGVGFGIEGAYDYMMKPSSPFFRGKGDFRSLATTEGRGYLEAYHRHELSEDTVMLLQTEYWEDEDIIKDFYYNEYRNRTEPRSFANVTYTQPTYLATGTFRYNVSDFVVETERLPEATYHLLERRVAERLYISFDTIDGLNEREPSDMRSWRLANVARASVDLDFAEALTIVPFYEADLSWYSRTVDDGNSDARFSNTVGVTAQSRFHRAYPGGLGFSGFKHVIVPSVTYSYRPEPTMDVDETPRFDAYDNVYGRSRIESKIGNILFARDALTGDVWQAARLTLYHGNDFWNEIRGSTDYEVELDLRPRPWWGILTVAENHSIENDMDLDEPYLFQRLALEFWEDMMGKPFDPELSYQYNAVYGDYDRILSYLYYDDLLQGGRFGARLGFAYTETQDNVFNREILYGARYKLGEKWAFAFEHRYDLERGDLYQQEYEVRKRFKCFDWSVAVRDRTEGWDFNVAISLSAFPGTKLKF